MSLYPVVPGAGDVFAEDGLMVAVRLADVASPLRSGRPSAGPGESALVIGGTERLRSGEAVVFCKVVAVAPAVVRRDGKVQAVGSPAGHATLGPLGEWLGEWAGPGVIEEVAGRAVLDARFVKGDRERLLTRAFMIRAIVLMTLMPDAGLREAVTALTGDLAAVPWARPWRAASERALGDWRNALGPGPLEELQAIVLEASRCEHEARGWREAVAGGLAVCSLDGTLVRVPDTPANREAFGSAGTGDGSSPFPQVRALPMNNVSTRGLLGMTHGPAGGGAGKAAGGQRLLDQAMEACPHLFTKERLWLMDRNFPGAARLARLTARTHVLIRLKGDIPLKRVSPILADGSYLADLSGDGLTIRGRVTEYFADVGGQVVPEMFCLVTDRTGIQEYPAPQLAALYKPLPLHPGAVGIGPLRAAAPDPAVPQQEHVQPLLHPLAVTGQVAAGTDQVPDRLLRPGRDPDRGQHPGPQGQRQPDRVAPAGPDPVRGPLRDQRRRDHRARHPHRRDQPVQLVARRAGLAADRQHAAVAQLPDHPPHRLPVVRDPLHRRDVRPRAEHPAHDLPHRGVHAHVDDIRP